MKILTRLCGYTFETVLLQQHEKTLAVPEQSSNWVGEINRLNQSTGIESLSAQLKARWRAINRNFPCISWPERPSVSVSSRFEQQTNFRLSRFSSLPCTARPGKVERCERSIGQSIEIELGRNFLCISWPRAAQREHDLPKAAAAALLNALTSYKLLIIFYYRAMHSALICLILQLILLHWVSI